VNQDGENEYGCPIRFQTGPQSVKNFETIINRLAPEQRAAFESERAEREAELESFVATHGYNT
jgi:hypothetical protein